MCRENNKSIFEITNKAKNALYNYSWPGNVRELRNAIESAVVLTKDAVIDIDDLPPHLRGEEDGVDYMKIKMPVKMDEIEKQAILFTLKLSKGNKTMAAELLNMNRKTLYTKLNEYEYEKHEAIIS